MEEGRGSAPARGTVGSSDRYNGRDKLGLMQLRQDTMDRQDFAQCEETF